MSAAMQFEAPAAVQIDVSIPFCGCGTRAEKRLVNKADSKYRGRVVWLCARGPKQQGGCGFFKPEDDPQPSAAAQQPLVNSHIAAAPPAHVSVQNDRKRSADMAGLPDYTSSNSSAKRAATEATTTPQSGDSVGFNAPTQTVTLQSATAASASYFGGGTCISCTITSSAHTDYHNAYMFASNSVVLPPTASPAPSNAAASSSSSGATSTSAATTSPAHSVVCKCGAPAALLQSRKQNENFGKKFYSCSKPMNERCKFFKWEHEVAATNAADQFPPQDRQVVRHDALAKQPTHDDPIGNVLLRDRQALDEFINLAKERRFTCMLASPFDLMYAHREVRLVKGPYNQEDFWLMVRPLSSGPAPAPKGVWLQVHGVRPDDDGYIISGQSHFVALQTDKEFLICSRRALWAYIDKHVLRETVTTPEQADHRYYKPGPLNEAITWISLDALTSWKDETIGIRSVVVDRWPRAGATSITPSDTTVIVPVDSSSSSSVKTHGVEASVAVAAVEASTVSAEATEDTGGVNKNSDAMECDHVTPADDEPSSRCAKDDLGHTTPSTDAMDV